MDSSNIYSTFFPGQQIEDPKWFAGRKFDIEKALKSLCSPGASIMVYGERGVGKSSFVEMLKLIAMGNSHLIYKYDFQKLFPTDKFKYKVISVECDLESNTTAKVLQRLITSPLGIKSLISSRIEKIESTMKDRYSLDFLKIFSMGGEDENKIISSEIKEESVFELFTNLILNISKNVLHNGEGLLIVIDEFDLVEDSFKMASLIKTLSKNNIKFLISGIAESYESLLKGHSSVSRQFMYGRINITPMTAEEVTDLFCLVEKNSNNQIRFEKAFVDQVFNKSNGFPYFVQLLGQLSLDNYVSTRGLQTPVIIHNQHLKNGIQKLGLLEYEMEKDYLSIIKENPLKEFLLKLMAKNISRKISDEEIHKHCYKKNIMPPIPKNTIASLLGHREPKFLIRDSDDSNFVSFKDPLFKTYIHTREPEFLRLENNEYIIP